MPCPHFEMTVISRGKNQSAVEKAAYQSGEKLYSERDHRTKYYKAKEDIVFTEIQLPPNAPPEYSDRNTLWNAVEAAEPNWNSQLCRRFVISCPRELSLEDNIALIREYCQKEFVARGMIADIGFHDPEPPGHNPHAHVLLTMRPMDEQGHWMKKARKEYVLDESGNRIRGRNGKWKTRKVSTADWDLKTNAETWRHDWEVIQNAYLEKAGRPERVSMKSLERQGIDRIPEVHMGPAVSALEKKGMRTNIGNLNRDIRKTNRLIAKLKQTITQLAAWLAEVKAAITEIEMQPKEVYLVDLLIQKFNERRNDRFVNWDNHAGARRAGIKDMKRFVAITAYMREKNILTVEALNAHMAEIQATSEPLRSRIRQIEKRMKLIDTVREKAARRDELKPIHDDYLKLHWKGQQKKYEQTFKAELDEWKKCDRYIRKNLPDMEYNYKALYAEYAKLQTEHASLSEQLKPFQTEVDMMKDIRWLVKDLLPELKPEDGKLTPEKKEEKRSVIEELHRKQSRIRETEKKSKSKEENIEH